MNTDQSSFQCSGFATSVNENNKYHINIEKYLIDNPISSMLVRMQSENMKNSGIFRGDLLVVNKAKKAQAGDIIIANIDGNYSIGILQTDDNRTHYLQITTPEIKHIFPEEKLEVFGVVVSLMRKMK